MSIDEFETRFKCVAEISQDISKYPLIENDGTLQVKTDKSKSDSFGEVFTPLWIVDNMLALIDDDEWIDPDKTTLDLCSGYGQFTIRLMRKKFSLLGNNFDIDKFLTETHYFSELQFESCYKLLYIFGTNINLFIGDSQHLSSVPNDAHGIWYYNDSWVCVTDDVINLYNSGDCNTFKNSLNDIVINSNMESFSSLDMEW